MIRVVVIVCDDVPGSRARVWGGEEENRLFGSGVSPTIVAIPLEGGWGEGRLSTNAPTKFRAWAVDIQRLTRAALRLIAIRRAAGVLRVFIDHVCDEEREELGMPESRWKDRHVPAWSD